MRNIATAGFICLENVVKPIIFERLINNIINGGDKTYNIQLALTGALIQVFFTLINCHNDMNTCLTGDYMRCALESLIFDKQLEVSAASNKKYSDAQITNLLNTQTHRIS